MRTVPSAWPTTVRTIAQPFAVTAALMVVLTTKGETVRGRENAAAQFRVRFAGRAQTAVALDVASIKPNVTWNQPGSGLAAPQPGGRYRGVGVTVRRLIGDAYGLPDARLVD